MELAMVPLVDHGSWWRPSRLWTSINRCHFDRSNWYSKANILSGPLAREDCFSDPLTECCDREIPFAAAVVPAEFLSVPVEISTWLAMRSASLGRRTVATLDGPHRKESTSTPSPA